MGWFLPNQVTLLIIWKFVEERCNEKISRFRPKRVTYYLSMKIKPFRDPISYFSPDLQLHVDWWLRARVSASDIHSLAYHHDYELHFIKKGQGKYIIGNKAYHFKTGYLVIIRPNQIHRFVPDLGHRIEKAGLMFPAEWQADFLNKIGFAEKLPNLICLSDLQSVCIEMIINRIFEENAQKAKGWEEMVIKLFQEFLLWVNRVKNQHVKPAPENPVFTQLLQYMESHHADPQCTVNSIARHFGYSRNYVTGLCKKTLGIGPKHYLQQYRITAARQILEAPPHIKVEAVARHVGFSQYRNFTRAFLSQTGITASKYRAFYHLH